MERSGSTPRMTRWMTASLCVLGMLGGCSSRKPLIELKPPVDLPSTAGKLSPKEGDSSEDAASAGSDAQAMRTPALTTAGEGGAQRSSARGAGTAAAGPVGLPTRADNAGTETPPMHSVRSVQSVQPVQAASASAIVPLTSQLTGVTRPSGAPALTEPVNRLLGTVGHLLGSPGSNHGTPASASAPVPALAQTSSGAATASAPVRGMVQAASRPALAGAGLVGVVDRTLGAVLGPIVPGVPAASIPVTQTGIAAGPAAAGLAQGAAGPGTAANVAGPTPADRANGPGTGPAAGTGGLLAPVTNLIGTLGAQAR